MSRFWFIRLVVFAVILSRKGLGQSIKSFCVYRTLTPVRNCAQPGRKVCANSRNAREARHCALILWRCYICAQLSNVLYSAQLQISAPIFGNAGPVQDCSHDEHRVKTGFSRRLHEIVDCNGAHNGVWGASAVAHLVLFAMGVSFWSPFLRRILQQLHDDVQYGEFVGVVMPVQLVTGKRGAVFGQGNLSVTAVQKGNDGAAALGKEFCAHNVRCF